MDHDPDCQLGSPCVKSETAVRGGRHVAFTQALLQGLYHFRNHRCCKIFNLLLYNNKHRFWSTPCASIGALLGRLMTEKARHCGSPARRIVGICLLFGLLGPALVSAQTEKSRPDSTPLTIGEIELQSADIFTQSEVTNTNGALRFMRHTMNTVHFNTRAYVIRRELLFSTGDEFDPESLEETERNLRNLGYLNNISIVVTDTTSDGKVNVVVNTREAWTLKTSFSYALASGGDQRWNASVSDGNFFGHGVTVGAGVGADENSSFWNAWFRQRRFLKTSFQLGLDYSQRQDGHVRRVILDRPFYALDDSWGMESRAWNQAFEQRFYLSNGGEAGLDPTETDRLYGLMAYEEVGVELRFQMRASREKRGTVVRLGVGVDVVDRLLQKDLRAIELSDGRIEDLTWLDQPGQPYTRERGTEVRPFFWAQTVARSWTKSRFVLQYGPIEDIPLNWVLDFKTGPSGGQVGSTAGYSAERWHSEASVQKWLPLGSGYLITLLKAKGDLGATEVRSYNYNGMLGWVGKAGAEMSPWLTRVFFEYGQGENLLGTQALLLGLDRGLRTLSFDGMAGDKLVRWNVEQGKAMPWEVAGLVRVGAAVFYNGGRAWWRDEVRTDYRHEAGLGIRFGPTRSANSQVARIDLSWNLTDSEGPVITASTRGFF